jgi:hypothetical protein
VSTAGQQNLSLNESAQFTTSQTSTLDSHAHADLIGPWLVAGQQYTVTVQGTFSPWAASLMSATPTNGWAMCGTPADAPLFPTPFITNGRVGSDAEFEFAQPQLGRRCSAKLAAKLPHAQHYLAFSTDGGSTFTEIDPQGSPTTPTSDHTYTYTVTGDDHPLQMVLLDRNFNDNYGQLQISVAPAPSA